MQGQALVPGQRVLGIGLAKLLHVLLDAVQVAVERLDDPVGGLVRKALLRDQDDRAADGAEPALDALVGIGGHGRLHEGRIGLEDAPQPRVADRQQVDLRRQRQFGEFGMARRAAAADDGVHVAVAHHLGRLRGADMVDDAALGADLVIVHAVDVQHQAEHQLAAPADLAGRNPLVEQVLELRDVARLLGDDLQIAGEQHAQIGQLVVLLLERRDGVVGHRRGEGEGHADIGLAGLDLAQVGQAAAGLDLGDQAGVGLLDLADDPAADGEPAAALARGRDRERLGHGGAGAAGQSERQCSGCGAGSEYGPNGFHSSLLRLKFSFARRACRSLPAWKCRATAARFPRHAPA